MGLRGRIKRLEESRGRGGPRCPDCGGGGPDEPDGGDTYELVFDGDGATEEWCPECGRVLSSVVYFPD